MNFTNFDQRRYPTVTPKVGYAEWANTHEASVPSLLDIGILERIRSVRWSETRQCLDLACGTGRTGSWLATKGVSQIDGVDFTPEMLTLRQREIRCCRHASVHLLNGDADSLQRSAGAAQSN